MFRIRPATPEDYYQIKALLEQRGKTMELTPQTGIMTVEEDGFAGIGMYELTGTKAQLLEVLTVNEADWELGFFIGKAILNKVDLSGAKVVICQNETLEGLLKKLGFREEGQGNWQLNLEGYFTSPCQKTKE